MKFLLTWRLHSEKRIDALKGFSKMTAADDKADVGRNIRLIGRWHDIADGTGVAIFESDDPIAMANWALNWAPVLDSKVTPVLDDEEVRKLGKSRK